MNSRMMDAFLFVIGIAAAVNGFLGRYLYNDADMSMTKEEFEDLKSPSKVERFIYISAGLIMAAYGFVGLFCGATQSAN